MKDEIFIIGCNIIEKNNRILLIQETLKEVKGKWNFPAGRLEMNEDIITCARREGREETGFKLKPLYLVGIYQHHLILKHRNVILFVFKSEIISGKLVIQQEEIMNAKWFSLNEIQELNKKRILRTSSILKAVEDYKIGKKIPLDFITILD